jgi:uncharacterized protein (DUF1499 family)
LNRFGCLLPALALMCAACAQSLPAQSGMPSAAAVSPSASRPAGVAKTQIDGKFSRLPLCFESNRGQTDSHVRFLTHNAAGTVFLTPSEAVFTLPANVDPTQASKRVPEREKI